MAETLISYFVSEHKEGVRHLALGTGKVLLLNPNQKVKLSCPKGCLCRVCTGKVPLKRTVRKKTEPAPVGYKSVAEAKQMTGVSEAVVMEID